MRILEITDPALIQRGAALFDDTPTSEGSSRFLAGRGHHLLFAFDGETPVGFVSGVELHHPDKGTEMYLNELGVAEAARGQGVATELVRALAELARSVGCQGLWGVTEPDNVAALSTYRRAGADEESPTVLFAWEF